MVTKPSQRGRSPGAVPEDGDVGTVHLVHADEVGTRGEVGEHEALVLRDRPGVVVTGERQVEAVEGRSTDPAVPVREGQVDGAE